MHVLHHMFENVLSTARCDSGDRHVLETLPVGTCTPLLGCIKQSITICVNRLGPAHSTPSACPHRDFDFYGLPLARANALKALFKFHVKQIIAACEELLDSC